MKEVTNPKEENSPQSILITGANGFTGQHACTYFATAGYTVYAVVRKPTTFSHENIQMVLCDLSDWESIQTVIQTTQPNFALHLAGQNAVQVSWENPIDTLVANVMYTAYLLDAIRTQTNKCRTVIAGSILQSNPAVPSSFLHPYSLSKTMQALYAEVYATLFELDVIIAKPSNLIGPGHSTGVCSILANKVAKMERGKEEKIIAVHNLLVERDFLDVRDAVKAYETLLLKGKSKKIYEINSGKTRSLNDIIHLFKQLATVDFEVKAELEQREKLIEINSLPLKKLGWEPKILFEQSLADILQYQRNSI